MAKQNPSAFSGVWQEIFHLGLYKRSQGRITRQVTFCALAIAIVLVGWRMAVYLNAATLPGWMVSIGGDTAAFRVGFPWVFSLIGLWLSYRVVNWPQFADFLIAVEAEMNKVSWPTRTEMIRSSIVVIGMIFILAAALFGYDMVWRWAFTFIGVLR